MTTPNEITLMVVLGAVGLYSPRLAWAAILAIGILGLIQHQPT